MKCISRRYSQELPKNASHNTVNLELEIIEIILKFGNYEK